MKNKKEVFLSLDIEADGPFPGLYSMLSVGYAAFTDDSIEPVSTFTRNLELIEGASQHPETMAWWNKDARMKMLYAMTRENMVSGETFVKDFIEWLNKEFPNNKFDRYVVCYPASFDWKFPDYYFIKYNGVNPLGFAKCIDIKSYVYARLGTKFNETTKRNMPKSWFPDTKHTHLAIDDAIEQGQLFMNIRKEFMQLPMIRNKEK